MEIYTYMVGRERERREEMKIEWEEREGEEERNFFRKWMLCESLWVLQGGQNIIQKISRLKFEYSRIISPNCLLINGLLFTVPWIVILHCTDQPHWLVPRAVWSLRANMTLYSPLAWAHKHPWMAWGVYNIKLLWFQFVYFTNNFIGTV